MNVKKGYEGRNRSMDSKLMEIPFVAELAKRAEQTAPGAIHVNAVNPGFCYSGVRSTVHCAYTTCQYIVLVLTVVRDILFFLLALRRREQRETIPPHDDKHNENSPGPHN